MKQYLYIVLFYLSILTVSAQHFSVTRTLCSSLTFSNNNLKNAHANFLATSINNDFANIEKGSSDITNNDYINAQLVNILALYQKQDLKKCVSSIIKIDNEIEVLPNIQPVTISQFYCIKYVVYNNYNLHADEEQLGIALTKMNDTQKYCLLYNVIYENCCFYDFIAKNYTKEFLSIALKTSFYDYVKSISLLIVNNKYENIDNRLQARDSVVNLIIKNNYKNSLNNSIKYTAFDSEKEFEKIINYEKIVSLNDLGVVARKIKNYDVSIKYFNDALLLLDNCSIKTIEPNLNTNLGISLTLKGDNEKAFRYYQAALSIYTSKSNNKKIAEVYNIISKNNFLQSKNNAALVSCNQSLNYSAPSKDYLNMCETYLLMSEIYNEEFDFQESAKNYKLYSDFKKLIAEEAEKASKLKLQKEKQIKDYETEAQETFVVQEQKKGELLKIKLESAQKENELLEMQHDAKLREASMAYNQLEKEKANQALALIEEKLRNKRKEIQDLEGKNKVNELENAVNEKKLELAHSRNYAYFQTQIINELKVDVIKKNQNYLKLGIVVLAILLFLVVLFLIRGTKNRKEIQIQNFKLSKKNEEIENQRSIITYKNKEIIDSINYAKKIQTALLPTEEEITEVMGDAFVLHIPKDIVSGDFYWLHESENYLFYATADCTGHGVPGGFMSMLAISLLNDIIKDKKIEEPCDVLDLLSAKLISELKQTETNTTSKDGMDITLVRLNKSKNELCFAAAFNDLWLIRNDKIEVFKADRKPVGFHYGGFTQFNQQKIKLQKKDMIFTFTDGFADQFGGEKGKKFKYKNLKNLLLSIYYLPNRQQKQMVSNTFDKWKGDLEQVDDLLLIGLKI